MKVRNVVATVSASALLVAGFLLTAGVAALWLAQHGRANLVAAARDRGETLQAMFLRLVRATARRPESWDPFEMGAGIVDAAALLAALQEQALPVKRRRRG